MATRDDGSFAGRHDDQVKSLTTQISFLEEEVAVLRRRLTDSPRQARLLEERLGEAEARLVDRQPAERAARRHAARGARPDRGAEGGSRPADQAAVGLRHLPQRLRGRRRGRVHRRPQDARQRQPHSGQRLAAARPGSGAERVADRRHRPGLRDRRRGRHAQGGPRRRRPGAGHLARRRGAGGPPRRAAAGRHAAGRRLAAAGAAVRVRVRAHPQGRGRGADPRGSPGHHLQRYRRPRLADRADPRRHRAAVPARRPVPRAPAPPAQGRPALRAARLRQDADRQGGRELAGQAGRGAHRAAGHRA